VKRNGNIVSFTVDEIDELLEKGEDLTDWARVDAMTEDELEDSIDEEDEGKILWATAMPVSFNLSGKKQLTIRLDEDILDWFKSSGSGYQTRINAVLRSYVEAQQTTEQPKPRRRKAS
jgi:uncharacterized protein (DUF4415 family)